MGDFIHDCLLMADDIQMDPQDLENLIIPVAEDKGDYSEGNWLFTGNTW